MTNESNSAGKQSEDGSVRSSESARPSRVAAVLGATAVAAGAFGAHALVDVLTPDRLDTWNTAARYQLIHAVALLALSGFDVRRRGRVAALWTAGTLIFSGSLYLLCLSGIGVLGAITPIGGVLLIAGWCALALPPRA